MVKLRDAGYCNVKLFLLFCVIWAHWMEPYTGREPVLLALYRGIYLVHMPLFAFLSGLFLKGEGDCVRSVKRSLPLCLCCQTAAVILGQGMVKWHTPWWHLWYLLSTVYWSGLAWLWFRFGSGRGGGLFLMLSVAAGCFAGNIPWLTRGLSGSRTVVFFPYFWLGVLLPRNIPRETLRLPSLAVLGMMWGVLNWVWEGASPVFLYQAAPFGAVSDGPLLRLGCYGAGLGLGMVILAWMPGKRCPFTRMGADTMALYLLHGPIVAALRHWELPVWGYPVAAAALMVALDGLLRWRSSLYGITEKKRRCTPWPGWKRSTQNTENRSTDSC